MKTAVVILNWNTESYLRRFIPGILKSLEGLDAELIVADNGSEDASLETMAELFPSVRVIPLGENFGFTGGYNRALSMVEAEYYLLLNSDIEVPVHWLSPLVEWMDSHPRCGACGPKLLSYDRREYFEYAGAAGGLMDKYGYPFCRGRILGNIEKDEGQYDSPEDVLWVSGACLMVRSSLWKSLGGLDERFFAHMEEIDLCWRMQLEGYSVSVIPASYVWHIGGGTLPNESPRKLKLNFRNNLLLLENNLPKTLGSSRKARWRIFIRKCLDGASALVFLLKGRTASFKAVIEAHREYRALRRPVAKISGKPIEVKGLVGKWIIPHALFSNDKQRKV